MKGFFRDPSNLKYSLNTIVPLVVFLTSLLSVVIGANVLTVAVRTHTAWMWVVVVCLFSSFCAFIVVRAMIQPINDLVKQAEKFVKFEELRKERGQMIEVYNLIERLMEHVKKETDGGDKGTLMESMERLDYIIPLGYMSLMVAHEVRNPLNTITGMSELLRQKSTDGSQLAYINAMLEAAKKIDKFTHDLLDFTDNELVREEFDLNNVVEDAMGSLSPELEGIECRFERKGSLVCVADKTKIFQVISNILRNAVEHERPGGFIKISSEKINTSFRVSVYNRHSTIGKDDLESIFKPFFSRKRGGRGLGLFIGMRNMRLHRGTIEVESGDEGTTFTIVLPEMKLQEDIVSGMSTL
ncbi:MAG: Sensor protein ZraS [Syntrophorhabdus sp. PtaU1.Bin058]|nr:MAG: Sensor protein ZraS [Syntrophorhabdus sp. PtaU1.Bin058]